MRVHGGTFILRDAAPGGAVLGQIDAADSGVYERRVTLAFAGRVLELVYVHPAGQTFILTRTPISIHRMEAPPTQASSSAQVQAAEETEEMPDVSFQASRFDVEPPLLPSSWPRRPDTPPPEGA